MAERQYGVAGYRQLVAIGFNDRTIARWLAIGRLHGLHRGAYAVGRRDVVQRGRWLAAVLACGEGAVLSHASAAALWGLTRARGAVDVTAPRGNQGRIRLQGIQLHRCKLDPAEIATEDRIPVTSIARTLFDFAEVAAFRSLEQAWEEADRRKLLRLNAIELVCERGYGRRALKPIRRLLAAARAPITVRSPLEERFYRFSETFDLPPFLTNVEVLGSEVDVFWPGAKLIVELDGWEFHRHRAAFQGDRRRDTRLLVAGYRTIRVTHERIDREAPTLAGEIAALLGAAETPAPGSVLPAGD